MAGTCIRGILGAILLYGAANTASAQNAACQIHDQLCIYHGIGREQGYVPSDTTTLTATANWDQANDADLHALLPPGPSYGTPTEALPGYPLQISEPFFPNVGGEHIYPNHYESQINGGAATATHSGDAGGGLAPYPGQPGCDPAYQSSVTCEAISVQGEVPSGVYSYAIHAFPESNSSFPLTHFTLGVEATGNMVLVVDDPSVINPITGLVEQVGSFQGSAATTAQLDVYALNVGHAGHVGGVTIPQMELVRFADGIERYQPVEPLLFDETPSIQDQIAGAFMQRDQQVTYYEALREQEKQRRAFEAELARQRAAYARWIADQEKAQAQAQQEKLVYMACPAPLKSCVPSYVKGEKFVLTLPAPPAPCNPNFATCISPPAKYWEPAKSWEQIVSETYQQSVVLKKPLEISKPENENIVDKTLESFYAYREAELQREALKCSQGGSCIGLVKESIRTAGQDYYLGTVEAVNDCVKGGGKACGEILAEIIPVGKVVDPILDITKKIPASIDNGMDVAKIDNSASLDTIPTEKVELPQVENSASLKAEEQLASLPSTGQKITVDTSRSVKGTPEYDVLNNPPANTYIELDNGTSFRTNAGGYVEEITFKPVDSPGIRDGRTTAVGKEGLNGDVGGHIQACSLGGSCDRFNLFPQNSNFNTTTYREWEKEITQSIRSGQTVGDITVRFDRSNPFNSRPDSLTIEYSINGRTLTRDFENQARGGQ